MLVIRGKVDEWRYQRNNAYILYSMHFENGKATSMKDALPLPFDSEIEDVGVLSAKDIESMEEEVKRMQEFWNKNDPFKKDIA